MLFATILAKKMSGGQNSFPICSVSIKNELGFVGNQQICECDSTLLQSGTTRGLDWTQESSSSCGPLNKMKILGLQNSPKGRCMGWGSPAAPGTIPPCQPRGAAAA